MASILNARFVAEAVSITSHTKGKANDHVDKLDRAQVSALAKQTIDGKLS